MKKILKYISIYTCTSVFTWKEHEAPVGMVKMVTHKADTFIISGDTKGVLKFWKYDTGECLLSAEEHSASIRCLAVSKDGMFGCMFTLVPLKFKNLHLSLRWTILLFWSWLNTFNLLFNLCIMYSFLSAALSNIVYLSYMLSSTCKLCFHWIWFSVFVSLLCWSKQDTNKKKENKSEFTLFRQF